MGEICNMDNILQTGTLAFQIHSLEIHSNLTYKTFCNSINCTVTVVQKQYPDQTIILVDVGSLKTSQLHQMSQARQHPSQTGVRCSSCDCVWCLDVTSSLQYLQPLQSTGGRGRGVALRFVTPSEPGQPDLPFGHPAHHTAQS